MKLRSMMNPSVDSSRPESNGQRTVSETTVRPKEAARRLYGMVNKEKRPNGELVFPSELHLQQNLTKAFRNGHIAGNRTSPRAFWLNLNDALEYVNRYISAAKENNRVYMRPTRHTSRECNVLSPAEPDTSVSNTTGSTYVLAMGSKIEALEEFQTDAQAALAALHQLGAGLYRVDSKNGTWAEVK